MTSPRRDPAELAAAIEQRVAKGLGLVDSFLTASGRGSRSSSKALDAEHRRAVAENKRDLARHRTRIYALKSKATAGAALAGASGAVGLIDAATGAPSTLWLWFGAAGVGLYVSVRARLKLRHVGPPPAELALVGPPPAIPRAAVGSAEIARLTSARSQILSMAPSLDHLYPGSGEELRRADNQAAGPLTGLAERLVVLDQLQRELPGTAAATTAARSAEVVRARLADGCDTYDELLAAAARLMAAPDVSRSTVDVLAPAVDAMLAYAHGLQKAADL